ncbi:MAG TPA: polysaccharide pyruvyl transferase family protein [Candidatus Saccharimonadales bacterium]|nr:polysaccharide pyruvyl transferase family protein [Candidatus Saccharimonadales bacterium]
MSRPTPPTRIVISHVYSRANKGDAALTSVLIQDLRRTFPDAAVTILTLAPSGPRAVFEGVPEKAGFMHYALEKHPSAWRKLAYVAWMIPATLLWAVWLRRAGRNLPLPAEMRAVAQTYASADMAVAVGGGYLRSRKGLANRLNVPLLLHPLVLCRILGKPTILYSQSVGPFMYAYEGWMAAAVLKRLTCVMLREDISLTLLAKLGVRHNTERTVDSGFLLKARGSVAVRKQYHIPDNVLLVGVTVRSWLDSQAQTAYEKAVAAALDGVVATCGAHVLFIPQVTAHRGDDDREASKRVRNYMRHARAASVITGEPDHTGIKAIYDKLDVLLGTRFHSVIFSLTSHVPVLAIEYEHKTSGIMHDLGLGEWVVKIEEINAAALTRKLRQLIQNRGKYRLRLQKVVPPYVERARQTAEVLADYYYNRR